MASQHRETEGRSGLVKPLREAPALGRRVSQALTGLKAIESDLSMDADPVAVCKVVAETVGEFLTADVVVVSGYGAEGSQALPIATHAATDMRINPQHLKLGLADEALRAVAPGGMLRIDADSDSFQVSEVEQSYLRDNGVSQAIIVPLVRQRRLLGRIDILLAEPLLFGQVELNLVLQAAGLAATALALGRMTATETAATNAETLLRMTETFRQAQPGTPAELVQVVVSLLPRLVDCERCYAYLWDADRNTYQPSAVSGMDDDEIRVLRQRPMSPHEVPLFEQVMYATRPIVMEEARQSSMLPKDLVEQLNMRSVLTLPLRGRRQEALGALMLDFSKTGRRFSGEQITLASKLAEQVSAMVETLSLAEEISHRSDRLAVLNEIGLDLASLTDLQGVLPNLHGKLATVIDATALFVALMEPETGRLTVYHMDGPELQVRSDLEARINPLLAQVFEEGESVLLPEAAMPVLTGLVSATGSTVAESLICVPMRVRGQEVIGALAAYSSYTHAYTKRDQEFISTVASQVAVAVENARLYSQVHARGELRGHLLNRIMSAHELERKSIVDDIHDESLQAMVSSMYKIDLCLRLSETKNHQRELEELRGVRSNLASNVDRLRALIFEIRPSTLDYLGLLPTLDDYLARLEETTGIQPTFHSELGARLESGMETLIYRLLQELLANVQKHSHATKVLIELKRIDRGVQVLVEDNGVGFDVEAMVGRNVPGHGIGLLAVRERVQVAGGQCVIDSHQGAGTRVQIVLPMTAGQHITGPLDDRRLHRDITGRLDEGRLARDITGRLGGI